MLTPPEAWLTTKLFTNPGLFGSGSSFTKSFVAVGVQTVWTDHIQHAVALKLRVPRLALIVNRRQAGRGEIPGSHCRSGHSGQRQDCGADDLPLDAEEKECFVLPDG